MKSSRTEIRKIETEVTKIKIQRRLKILQELSLDRIDFFGPLVMPGNKDRFEYETYELGIVALFSLVADKYNYKNLSDSMWLRKTIKIVRDQTYLSNIFEDKTWNGVAALAYMQFHLKQYVLLFYRSHFLYTFKSDKIDIKSKFKEIFGTDYSEFLTLFACVFAYSKMKNISKVIKLLKKLTPKALDNLVISQDGFSKLYDPFYKWRDSSFVNFNFLLRYPFIEYKNDVYIPYFPAIPYAITESLMFELTRNDDRFRENVGKYAFEDYINHITRLNKANENCKILKEIIYNKEEKRSSDIIVINGNDILLVEVKFMNYRLSLRHFDESSIIYTEQRMVEYIEQVYKNIIAIRGKSLKHLEFPIDVRDIIGVIVILEDYYLDVESIYRKASENISKYDSHITIDSLKEMICFTSLYSYERIMYYSKRNVVEFFQDILHVKKQYNYWEYLSDHNSQKGGINMKEVNEFYQQIMQNSADILKSEENL